MAYLEVDPDSGNYRVRFRYAGRSYKRSLKTKQHREAQAIRGRIAETLWLIERGRLEVPVDADPATFILSDGKLNGKPKVRKVQTLNDLFDAYQEMLPEGAKEVTTLVAERRHMRHLSRHLKASKVAQSITVTDLQGYVEKRSHDCWLKKPIRPDTIKKELTTFRLIWNWAVDHGHL